MSDEAGRCQGPDLGGPGASEEGAVLAVKAVGSIPNVLSGLLLEELFWPQQIGEKEFMVFPGKRKLQ